MRYVTLQQGSRKRQRVWEVYERLGLHSGFPETRLSLASRKVSVEPSEASHVGSSAPPARRRRLNIRPLLPVDGRDRVFVPAITEGHEDGASVWSSSDPDEAWARQCSIPRSCRHSGVLSSRRHRVLRSCRHSALGAPFSDNFGGHTPSRPTLTRDDDNFGGSAQGRRSSEERLIPLVW